MWPLRLSTRASAEVNAQTLTTALLARRHEVAAAVAAVAPQDDDNKDNATSDDNDDVVLDVLLCVHDGCRDTFMTHAHVLYNTVVHAWPVANVAVIPVVHTANNNNNNVNKDNDNNNDDNDACERLTSARMAALPGFAPRYRHVAVGGTFDRLHAGHKLLLSAAVLHTTHTLLIGVANDVLLQRKRHRERLQPLPVRQARVRAFVQRLRADVVDGDDDNHNDDSSSLRVTIRAITHVAGGADRLPQLQALVVSPETERALAGINETRRVQGNLPPLTPILVPFVTMANGHILSSSTLREDEASAHTHTS